MKQSKKREKILGLKINRTPKKFKYAIFPKTPQGTDQTTYSSPHLDE